MKTSLLFFSLVISISSLIHSQVPVSIQGSIGLSQPVAQDRLHNRDLGFSTNAALLYQFSPRLNVGINVGYSVFRYHKSVGAVPASGFVANPSKDNTAAQIGIAAQYRPWLTDWPGMYLFATLGIVRNEIPDIGTHPTSFEPKPDRSYGLTYSLGIGKEIEITRQISLVLEGLFRQNRVQVYEYYAIRERVHVNLNEITLNSGLKYSF